MKRLTVDDIKNILQNGKNEYIEFKYGTIVTDVISKCIAGFANANGGRIIVGYNERQQKLMNRSTGDERKIERALQQLENPPEIDCYEVRYDGYLLLIVDIEPNQQDFTYFKGAIYVRINDQVQLMGASDVKAAYNSKFEKNSISPYDAIEKMNIKNAEMQSQIAELEKKLDRYHSWDVSADKSSFRWAIFFCVAGSVLGAIIGTILGKFF